MEEHEAEVLWTPGPRADTFGFQVEGFFFSTFVVRRDKGVVEETLEKGQKVTVWVDTTKNTIEKVVPREEA